VESGIDMVSITAANWKWQEEAKGVVRDWTPHVLSDTHPRAELGLGE